MKPYEDVKIIEKKWQEMQRKKCALLDNKEASNQKGVEVHLSKEESEIPTRNEHSIYNQINDMQARDLEKIHDEWEDD